MDQTPPTISVFTVGSGNPASTNTAAVTLYITASDGTGSGVYQIPLRKLRPVVDSLGGICHNEGLDAAGHSRDSRVYLGVKDNLGNETATNGTWDEIRAQCAHRGDLPPADILSNDGDNDLFGEGSSGEIYYTFYIDGVTKLYRLEPDALTVTSPDTIPPGSLAAEFVYDLREPNQRFLYLDRNSVRR